MGYLPSTSEVYGNPHQNHLQPRPRNCIKRDALVNWLSLRRRSLHQWKLHVAYVRNAGKLAVRREEICSGDKAVKMPAHAHSCDGFKPTDKLTLQVVVDQDTEKSMRIQVTSMRCSFHTFWQCNPRIAACFNVEHDEQLVCSNEIGRAHV